VSVLPRPAASDRGVVLRVWPTGETSSVASVLTAEHGLVRLLAKGARQTRSRLRPLVQPGRLVELEFSLDPARELQFLRGGGLLRDPLAAAPTLEKSAYLQAALELVDRCRPGHGHEAGLFPLCHGFLEVLSCAGPGREAALFYAFETALLELLGTGPELAGCVHCGRDRDDLAGGGLWFSPAGGGLVCGDCARAQGVAGARPLTAESLALWPELTAAPRRWPDRTLPRAVARDWGVMLHRFLEYHLPGYRLPAALALLRAGRGADARDRTE
jgi:DNA repair protein RecO (recombination protein O)